MTKKDAIEWMQLGARCEHTILGTGEWITINEGFYILEDGLRLTPEEFWRDKQDPIWNTKWEFAKGWDPFTCIASREFGVSYDSVGPYMRNVIKQKYFALVYGKLYCI